MAAQTDTGILLHPGGGGAQYPYRFKPFRPRNLWRRTPGPRPPRGPVRLSRVVVSLVVIGLIVAAVLIGLANDWFGPSSSGETPTLTVSHVQAAGFIIDGNTVDGQTQVLTGSFEGMRASVLIPLDPEFVLSAQLPEAQRALDQYSEDWDVLRAGESLVICLPVQKCTDLIVALAEAVFSG